jgi:hypothetical protein
MSTEPREPRPGRSRKPVGCLVMIVVIAALAVAAYLVVPRLLVRMVMSGGGPIPAATTAALREATAGLSSTLRATGLSREQAVGLIRRLTPRSVTALAQAARPASRPSATSLAEAAIRELKLDQDTASRLLASAKGQTMDPAALSRALGEFDKVKGMLPVALPVLKSALEETVMALPEPK